MVQFREKGCRFVMAVLIALVFLQLADAISAKVTYLMCGEYEAFSFTSLPHQVRIVWGLFFGVLSIHPAVSIWKRYLRVEQLHTGKHRWCVLFPLSQLILMGFCRQYDRAAGSMSWLTLAGMMLGCAAIFGMFHLFKREQEREQVEQLLRQERQLYQMEREEHEKLKQAQAEVAKIRHDYQNQVMVLERLLQEEQKGGYV